MFISYEHYKKNRVIQRFITVVCHAGIPLNIEVISDSISDNGNETVVGRSLQQQFRSVV